MPFTAKVLEKFSPGTRVRVTNKLPYVSLPVWQLEMDITIKCEGIVKETRPHGIYVRVALNTGSWVEWWYAPRWLVVLKVSGEERAYNPKLTVRDLELLIGPRGSSTRRTKRSLIITWIRAKTSLPFKPYIWAIKARTARIIYDDVSDQRLKDWVEFYYPAKKLEQEPEQEPDPIPPRVKVESCEVLDEFSRPIIIRRPGIK